MAPSPNVVATRNNQSTFSPSFTLPSRVYTAGDVFEKEQEQIFARTWQYVGHVERVRSPGDYFVEDVANESVIVLRDNNGALNAFFNVCAHRAARVASGAGSRKRFSCPYHGWTYDLAGALVAAPNATNVAGFKPSDHRLKPCRVEEMHGLVFVNLDAAATPLSQFAPGLEAEIKEYVPNLPDLTFVHRTEAPLQCNWKIAAENFAECYHCSLVHKSFTQGVVDPESYRVRVHGTWQKHHSRSRTGAARAYDFDDMTNVHASEFGAWWMWPNFAFQCYPGGAAHVWKWTPSAVGKTHIATDWFMPSTELKDWQRTLIDHHASTTFAEDIPLVEAVQQGVASRAYDRGRLMIDGEETQLSEHAVAAIQNLWRNAMGEGQ